MGNILGEQGDIGNQSATLIMSTFSANSYETAIVRISVAIVYSYKMSKLSSEIRKQNKLTMCPVDLYLFFKKHWLDYQLLL